MNAQPLMRTLDRLRALELQLRDPAMWRASFLIFATFMLLTSQVGCQQDRINGPRTAADDVVPLEGYPNVLLRDGLDESLKMLGRPDVQPPTPLSAMSVRVRLRSVSERTLVVRFRFRFYGPNREVLTQDPVWQTVDIPPTHDRTFEARALELRAADWELEVSEWR
jgi:hypothetical protein